MCTVQLTTCTVQRTTCTVQRTTCTVQRTTCTVQRTTCTVQRTTCPVGAAQPRVCAKAGACARRHARSTLQSRPRRVAPSCKCPVSCCMVHVACCIWRVARCMFTMLHAARCVWCGLPACLALLRGYTAIYRPSAVVYCRRRATAIGPPPISAGASIYCKSSRRMSDALTPAVADGVGAQWAALKTAGERAHSEIEVGDPA